MELTEPTSIRAGDSVAWSRDLPAYPAADGWALKYRILWPAGAAEEIATTADGTRYDAALSAADTATFAAGRAVLVSLVERGAGAGLERATLGSSPLDILPNLATAAAHDGRSQNEIALAHARAALATYMANGQLHVAEYDIAGRRMKFRSAAEIRELIQYYESEVGREQMARAILNGGASRRVQVRF